MIEKFKKVANWASVLDPATREQALQTASMDFVWPHLALMPDAHLGKGATVGSVIPTVGAIMPAAVGVDIGCGMIAVKTQFTKSDFGSNLRSLREDIATRIPLSAGNYNKKISPSARRLTTKLESLAGERNSFYAGLGRTHWIYQLGTLGSGNHFIEITADEDDAAWLFLHSGSRGIGNLIASHHIKIAKQEMSDDNIKLPNTDLAYLTENTDSFNLYILDLMWAQTFALFNRQEMMNVLINTVEEYMDEEVKALEEINCHHNFTNKESHYGKDVWLSRKGAISANLGQPGLIPGSMGTLSYVVQGKGNQESFNSSPHGAGRMFSRGTAKSKFTLEDLAASMEGVEYNHSSAFLDEHPEAYKDIDIVMEDSKDLVEINGTLKQFLNVKGN